MRVFLSSPEDLTEERKRFPSILEKVNKRNAEPLGIILKPSMWEHTLPGRGRPQERINKDKLTNCHLFIGLLWKRWGSPTGLEGYTSGLQEEYDLAKSSNKETWLYFRTMPESLLKNPDDQAMKVLEFKQKVRKEVFFCEYKDETEWEDRLHDHLSKWVNDQFRTKRAEEEGRVPAKSQVPPLKILFERNAEPYYRETLGTRTISIGGTRHTYLPPADTAGVSMAYSESRTIKMHYRLVKVKNVANVTARKCRVRITVSRNGKFSPPLLNKERIYSQWDIENAKEGNEPLSFDLNPEEDRAMTICHTEQDRPDMLFFDDQGKISNARQANPFKNGTYYLRVHAYSEDRAPSEADFIITKGEGYDKLEMRRVNGTRKPSKNGEIPKERIDEGKKLVLDTYSVGDFEETRPTLVEKSDASEDDVRKNMDRYGELRSKYEKSLIERYHNEDLVEWGGQKFPVSVLLQEAFAEGQVKERLQLDSDGRKRKYVLAKEVRQWGEANFLAFMKENPLVKRGKPLYDGSMARLVKCERVEGLTLSFEQTSFYDHLRTNLAMDVCFKPAHKTLREILEPGENYELSSLEDSKCANGFGVGCIVRTCDGKFVVVMRSGEVSNARLTFAPSAGGVVNLQRDRREERGAPSIFKAVRRHLEQEMTVSPEQINRIVFLGITRELERGGYPDGHFYVELNESFENLRNRRLDAEHEEEIKYYIPVEPGEIAEYITESGSSPGLRGCIYLLTKAGLDKPA